MDVADIILLVIRWAHALAAVVWIGGSLFMLLAARPALLSLRSETGDDNAVGLLGRALSTEFRPIVLTAIGVLIVSGVVLTVDRLTSDAAGVAYTVVLVAKIALAVYAFVIAWLLPRRGNRVGSVGGVLSGPAALTVAGVIVIGLADVLTWLFERGLAG
ncbi:MAG: hypothetical protein F4W95_10705 [Chloroflexi bacterium]|nr:hypothetical protein [Chloroflexota bacterium]MYD48941.1 hypothetical protein [Chloroflexota bacterium]